MIQELLYRKRPSQEVGRLGERVISVSQLRPVGYPAREPLWKKHLPFEIGDPRDVLGFWRV
jgi:hypothetical protein